MTDNERGRELPHDGDATADGADAFTSYPPALASLLARLRVIDPESTWNGNGSHLDGDIDDIRAAIRELRNCLAALIIALAARIESGTDETAKQAQPRRGESRKCPPKL